jgi:hypothetical protein
MRKSTRDPLRNVRTTKEKIETHLVNLGGLAMLDLYPADRLPPAGRLISFLPCIPSSANSIAATSEATVLATVNDFAWWSGLTLTDAKRGLGKANGRSKAALAISAKVQTMRSW